MGRGKDTSRYPNPKGYTGPRLRQPQARRGPTVAVPREPPRPKGGPKGR